MAESGIREPIGTTQMHGRVGQTCDLRKISQCAAYPLRKRPCVCQVVVGNNTAYGYNYTRVAEYFLNHTLINNDTYIQNSLVELQIYLQTNDIQCVVEVPDLQVSTVLSSLGAVIGMYTHSSVRAQTTFHLLEQKPIFINLTFRLLNLAQFFTSRLPCFLLIKPPPLFIKPRSPLSRIFIVHNLIYNLTND